MSSTRNVPPMDRPTPTGRAVARTAGFAAPVLALAAILLATAVSPTFSWRTSALSDLGVSPSTGLLFNGGLLVGAALALPYGSLLRRDARGAPTSVWRRLTAVAFVLAAVSMGLVGVFVSGHSLHFPVAAAFYLLVTLTLALDGAARRATTTGAASLTLAAVHVVVWAGWIVGVVPGGLAVPETVGAFAFAAWMLLLSPVSLLARGVGDGRGVG